MNSKKCVHKIHHLQEAPCHLIVDQENIHHLTQTEVQLEDLVEDLVEDLLEVVPKMRTVHMDADLYFSITNCSVATSVVTLYIYIYV